MEAAPMSTTTVLEATAVDQTSASNSFSANKLFGHIKSAISSIPVNEALFAQSVSAIEQTTAFINKNTNLVVVFDVEKLQELLGTIDEVVSKNLMKLDDGFDHLRAKLGASLTQLSTAIHAHKDWVQTIATETSDAVVAAAPNVTFSTAKIFSLLKNALASIPINQKFFDQSISAIDQATAFINKNTRFNVVFDAEKLQELIGTVDCMISQNLVKFDDGFDNVRARLNSSLRELKQAAESHREWVTSAAVSAEQSVSEQVRAKYAMSRDALALAVSLASENLDAARTAVMSQDKSLQEKVVDSASYLLQSVQPYVQDAVKRGQPLVNKALETAQPYIDKSKPYTDPVVDKAADMNKKLQSHEMVGPYVTKAVDTATTVFQATQEYCAPGPAAAASATDGGAATTAAVVQVE